MEVPKVRMLVGWSAPLWVGQLESSLVVQLAVTSVVVTGMLLAASRVVLTGTQLAEMTGGSWDAGMVGQWGDRLETWKVVRKD
jgi:hypothetical protein